MRAAVLAGARVLAVTRRASARGLAKSLGAQWVMPLEDREAVLDAAAEHTSGRMCDRVVECVGLQAPLDLAGALTRERGRRVVAGFHQDGTRQVDMQLWNWRGLDVINAHERDARAYAEGIRLAAQWVEEGRIDVGPLLTHSFPLHQVGRAFEALHTRPEGFLKALVTVGP
jgi:threonine dehydrogenase-like Zn-dependent dehydrogenase